jgi:hypothetical protein
MTQEELRERTLAIKDPARQPEELYALLDAAGITYQKSTCHRCRIDLYNILREELGLIESAAEESDFNELPEGAELVFIYPRPVKFNGKIIKKSSSQETMLTLYRVHPEFFLVQNTLPIE